MDKWISLSNLYLSREYRNKIAGIAGDDVAAVIEAAVRRNDVRKIGKRIWSNGRGPIEPILEYLSINGFENSMRVRGIDGPSWSDIEISEVDFFSFLSSFYCTAHPLAADVRTFGFDKDSSETGLPGRPTSKHLLLAELARRNDAGEVARTIADEARYLHNWLEATHPTKPRSGAKSIENAIRATFNANKRMPLNPP